MNLARLGAFALAATAATTLAGCTDYYGGYGYGYSRPYYSSSYRYPYNYYNRSQAYNYGYSTPYYYGWYDNFYYPGVGVYVYNDTGSRYRWNSTQQRYWEGRRGGYRGGANWSGYRTDGYRRR